MYDAIDSLFKKLPYLGVICIYDFTPFFFVVFGYKIYHIMTQTSHSPHKLRNWHISSIIDTLVIFDETHLKNKKMPILLMFYNLKNQLKKETAWGVVNKKSWLTSNLPAFLPKTTRVLLKKSKWKKSARVNLSKFYIERKIINRNTVHVT